MGIFDSFKKKTPRNNSGEVRRDTSHQSGSAPGRWQVGDIIEGRYEIRQILGGPGKSGMGIIYCCYDREFNIYLALKTFQDKYLRDPSAVEAFKNEANAWFKLGNHPNIVRAYWVSEINGKPYVFMEYIESHKHYGADLSGWIHQGGLHSNEKPDIPLILNFAIQICCGMDYAHNSLKIVHRDIKPANILVTLDKKAVKVTDFGLVKVLAEMNDDIQETPFGADKSTKPGFSKSGNICGTPPYMSPEQCRGDKAKSGSILNACSYCLI
ncbi:serine/threonine protein kinase, partial [Chloroflexota bacterium]